MLFFYFLRGFEPCHVGFQMQDLIILLFSCFIQKQLDQPTMPEEGAELPPRCDARSATKSNSRDNSSSRASNAERPKRSVGWINHYQHLVVYCFVF